jgi:hypothetical protein
VLLCVEVMLWARKKSSCYDQLSIRYYPIGTERSSPARHPDPVETDIGDPDIGEDDFPCEFGEGTCFLDGAESDCVLW